MEQFELSGKRREIFGKKVGTLRRQGVLPGILYGHEIEPVPLELPYKTFEQVYKQAGESTLIKLAVEGKEPVSVLVHEVQRDPITSQILHTDLYQVKMTEKIRTEIPLHIVGISSAVEELEGNLIMNTDKVDVECLPKDLVTAIEVDVSHLRTFEDQILIKDLKIPSGITILDDPEVVAILVTPPRSEEELKSMETEAAAEVEQAQIEKIEEEAEKEKAEKESQKTEGEEKVSEESEEKTPQQEKK